MIINPDMRLINHSLVPVHTVGHDVIEVVNGHKSVFIKICSVKHILDFFISEIFSQVLSDFLQLMPAEFSLSYTKYTARLGSKAVNTLVISARLSFSPILAVASLKNSAKSIPPDWSSSSSAKI